MKKLIIWINLIFCITYMCISVFSVYAADRQSILNLLRTPISGISIPEDMIAKMDSYMLANPSINYDELEKSVLNARATIEESVKGKSINSARDLVNAIDAKTKAAIIADLRNAASTAKLTISVDENEKISVVNEKNGTSIVDTNPMIKDTGLSTRSPVIAAIITSALTFILTRNFRYTKFTDIA